MMNVNYKVNNIDITPTNHKELQIELNFDKDNITNRLSLNRWVFDNKNASPIYDIYNSGLTGGTGIFEGIPFDINVVNNGASHNYKHYLDLTNADLSCHHIEIEGKERAGIDWLNDIADGFTFEYLREKTNFLPASLDVSIPYIINSIPNYKDSMICAITIGFTTTQLNKVIQELQGALAAMANPATALSEVVNAALLIVYCITLIATLIKLINDLIDLIIQPVKYHKGMYAKDLLESGCAYLGLTFQSSLFDGIFSKTVILPKKLSNPINEKNKKLLGFESPSINQKGYFDGTFGDLLRAMKLIFKAKIILKDNVLILEREDYSISSASYVIPDILQDQFTTNADELNSNYVVEFTTDVSDKNTIQDYRGNIIRVYTTPQFIVNRDLLLTKGLENNTIPFALARRKETLTIPEELVKAFLVAATEIMNTLIAVVNGIISILNAVTKAINALRKVFKLVGVNISLKIPSIPKINPVNWGQIIEDRIGMLSIETDFTTVDKIMILNESASIRLTKIHIDNISIFNAKYLYDNFHYIQSFVPDSAGKHNQWIRKKISNVPFTFEDYEKVLDNSKIYDSQGKIAKIESLKWNVWKQLADIEYRINELFTTNLKSEYYEAQGF